MVLFNLGITHRFWHLGSDGRDSRNSDARVFKRGIVSQISPAFSRSERMIQSKTPCGKSRTQNRRTRKYEWTYAVLVRGRFGRVNRDGRVRLNQPQTTNLYKKGVGWVQKHENYTANNRESTRIAFFQFRPLDLVVSLLGRVTTLRLIGFAWS